MTAGPEAESRAACSAPQTHRSSRLRQQLLVERAVFLAAIIVLAFVVIRQGRALSAWRISVNGKPVVIVADRATAQRVLDGVRGEASQARFRQMVSMEKVNPRAVVVAPENRARAIVARAVSVIVPAHVIVVNGRIAAALATREEAERVLARVRRAYAGPSRKARFKESVSIEAAEIARSKVVSPEEAYRSLTTGAPGRARRAYQVQAGDTAWEIASRHRMTVQQLAALNPQVNLDHLQQGQTLAVGDGAGVGAAAPLTVLTVEERTETEAIPYSTSVINAPNLPRGQRRVASPGRAGQKRVRYRITRENGRVVKREAIAETVVRRPQPQRVLVGTAP